MDYDKLIERMKEPDCDECTYEEKQVCAGSAHCVLFEYATECIEELRSDLARVTEERDAAMKKYEAEKKDFLCYALSGAQNAAPFCTNRHPDCVDKRGWCVSVKCHGFSREKEN